MCERFGIDVRGERNGPGGPPAWGPSFFVGGILIFSSFSRNVAVRAVFIFAVSCRAVSVFGGISLEFRCSYRF